MSAAVLSLHIVTSLILQMEQSDLREFHLIAERDAHIFKIWPKLLLSRRRVSLLRLVLLL